MNMVMQEKFNSYTGCNQTMFWFIIELRTKIRTYIRLGGEQKGLTLLMVVMV